VFRELVKFRSTGVGITNVLLVIMLIGLSFLMYCYKLSHQLGLHVDLQILCRAALYLRAVFITFQNHYMRLASKLGLLQYKMITSQSSKS